MFVEQAIWKVPRDRTVTSMTLLNTVAIDMHKSGGLVRFFSGEDIEEPQALMALSFWKCWEDLSRFMGSSRNTFLSESSRLLLHQFEIVWEWPQEEVNTVYGDTYWALHEYTVTEEQIQSLLDAIRQSAPSLRGHNGFRSAAIWMDKHSRGHVVFAVQSSGAFVDLVERTASLFPGDHSRRIVRLKAVNHMDLTVI